MTKLNLQSYPNPPVIEVAWEIRFEKIVLLDSKIEQLRKLFQSDLPHFERMEEKLFEFNIIKEEGLTSTHGYLWEFADSPKKQKIIQFNDYKLSIITRSHKHFSDLLKFITTSLQKFSTIWESEGRLLKIIRLGLRYINVCRFPEDDKNRLSEWYHTPFNNDLFDIKNAKFFDMIFTKEIGENQLTTKYRTATVVKKNAMILDFDCFSNRELKIEDLERETTKLRDIIRENFENSITKEFEKYEMRREKEE